MLRWPLLLNQLYRCFSFIEPAICRRLFRSSYCYAGDHLRRNDLIAVHEQLLYLEELGAYPRAICRYVHNDLEHRPGDRQQCRCIVCSCIRVFIFMVYGCCALYGGSSRLLLDAKKYRIGHSKTETEWRLIERGIDCPIISSVPSMLAVVVFFWTNPV